MHEGYALIPAQPRQAPDVEEHLERVLGRGRKSGPDAALGLQLADEAAALAGNERAPAYGHESGRDINGRALGAARLELGNDLQDRAPGKGMGPQGRIERARRSRCGSHQCKSPRMPRAHSLARCV
jgi:hypothetical protein